MCINYVVFCYLCFGNEVILSIKKCSLTIWLIHFYFLQVITIWTTRYPHPVRTLTDAGSKVCLQTRPGVMTRPLVALWVTASKADSIDSLPLWNRKWYLDLLFWCLQWCDSLTVIILIPSWPHCLLLMIFALSFFQNLSYVLVHAWFWTGLLLNVCMYQL